MFGRRKRVDEQLDDIQSTLVELRHDADLLRTVLVIREPDTVTAANAYEGLRKQIVAVAQEHWAHLAQLVEMDVSINHTDSIEVTRGLVADWIIRSGIQMVRRPENPEQLLELFDDLGGSGPVIEVRSPAYVDAATGRIIRKGRFARAKVAPPAPVARRGNETSSPERTDAAIPETDEPSLPVRPSEEPPPPLGLDEVEVVSERDLNEREERQEEGAHQSTGVVQKEDR